MYSYATTNIRITSITRGASTVRAFTYDNAGNLLTDNSLGGNKSYVYNRRNRLSQATVGALIYDYQYNAQEQLAVRTQASPAATTHFIHDIFGNVIAETAGGGATGASGTVREYIWLPEAEIAPTMGSRAAIDRPMATVEAVNTVAPVLQFVHVDHLHRPVKMTNAAKATVWDASVRSTASKSVAALRRAARGDGCRQPQPPLPRPVVPGRNGLALQLAPQLRSNTRPLHPTRPTRLRGWPECLWVCGWQPAGFR
ncbi:MAG: hypothetical protein SH859_10905 [Hyphomicrobium aestuarii]|nr:hypothetical protein [Hyphomicrobium aestuarii]